MSLWRNEYRNPPGIGTQSGVNQPFARWLRTVETLTPTPRICAWQKKGVGPWGAGTGVHMGPYLVLMHVNG